MQLNKIYNLDVFEFFNIVPNNFFDLAIVDPPYNLKIASWDNFKSEAEFLNFSYSWIEILLKKLKKTGSFYIFNTPFNCAKFLNFLDKKAKFQNFITWYKKDGFANARKRYNSASETILFYTMSDNYTFNYDDIRVPYESTKRIKHARKNGILKNGKRWFPNSNGKLCPDVWEIVSQRHKEKVNGKVIKPSHPTIKPKEMIERMIKASSNESDLVLDLFSGSGMTSLVAKELGRNFIGCEIDKNYIDKNLILKEK